MSQTDFGYRRVDAAEKAARVAGVFSSVADRYDLMNDLMSGGLHRLWKAFTVALAGVREGERVLDVAAGSGDLAREFAKRAGPGGEVWLTDINRAMLERGRDRLLDRGMTLPAVQCDAEALPFPSDYFDCVNVAFGLRNMTDKEKALAEMRRVLKPAGRLLVLEFSRVWQPLSRLYDWYSFTVLPWLGRKVAGDEAAYRYLAESIRMHPDQEHLKAMLQRAGLEKVEYFNLSAGVAALHRGYKI
ncbi:MAG TPA: bifunctional demethylmenaquinone methyltransferase/2-methoxy-6-polyprenyl-1,4-benzoquinol methylase UbiE [Burkholderiales bacterium]|nr:bifunctional demethylmenaquinone methyltransferase/2-methoxy-6-polyprenyl-1,4-benzoquinol methylase UbiE [Burkholderiales bacterium]